MAGGKARASVVYWSSTVVAGMPSQHYQDQGLSPVLLQVRTLNVHEHAHLLLTTHGVQHEKTSYITGHRHSDISPNYIRKMTI